MWWKILIGIFIVGNLIYAIIRVGAKADEDSAKWLEKQKK